jgi:hypothetical protein
MTRMPSSGATVFETLLVASSMLRIYSTYGGELISDDSVLRGGCFETTSVQDHYIHSEYIHLQ